LSTKFPAECGNVVIANQVVTYSYSPQQIRRIILLLAGCVALMMTGFGIILPIFGRRLSEWGAGVEALGLMTMAFALSQFVAAPFMGSLADKIGRRPLILLSLISFAFINIGFLFAQSPTAFILLRALEGGLTAGLFPSAMGVIGDISPENERGRWAGILMGGYGAGFIFGPVIGALLFDYFGFSSPFIASALFAIFGFIAAFTLVPETRTKEIRKREMLRARRLSIINPEQNKNTFWDSLPRPLAVFGTLLIIDFAFVFAFAFVEPQMIFYLYEELGWSTMSFGIIVSIYGAAMVIGQATLGRLSDRYARKPVITLGLLINSVFYVGLTVTTYLPLMAFVALISGLGEALSFPALNAFYIDITSEKHRSRVLGIKEASAALGAVLGPLLVALISRYSTSREIFIIATITMLVTVVLALIFLREPDRSTTGVSDIQSETSRQRAIAAQSTLRGIVIYSNEARRIKLDSIYH
jgi:multidrug resistance protein